MNFDLRIRPIPNSSDFPENRFRVVVLPFGNDLIIDTKNSRTPWAKMNEPPSKEALRSLNPDDPESVDPEEAKKLWLPAHRTLLAYNLPANWRRYAITVMPDTFEARYGFTSDGKSDGQPANDPIICFGGFDALLHPDKAIQALSVIDSLRHTREVIGALLKAFRFPGELMEFAAIDQASGFICLTHLVFDVAAPDDASFADFQKNYNQWPKSITVSPPDPSKETLTEPFPAEGKVNPNIYLRKTDRDSRIPVNVEVMQDAKGVWFRLLGSDKMLSDKQLSADECSLHLRRSSGDIPSENPPLVEQTEFDIKGVEVEGQSEWLKPSWNIHDRLPGGLLAGQQLHYQLDLQDSFGDVVATTRYSLVRERRDLPPQPSEAVARLVFNLKNVTDTALEIEALYPGIEQQLTGILIGTDDITARLDKCNEQFEVNLFCQRRPLDECGFYGDDDDFALLEGLRQLDPNFDPKAGGEAGEQTKGGLARKTFVGQFDEDGLERIDIKTYNVVWTQPFQKDDKGVEDESKRDSIRVTATLGIAVLEEHADQGCQFHIALRRKLQPPKKDGPMARIAACTHEVVLKSGDPKSEDSKDSERINVFQLEYFDAPSVDESVDRVWRFLNPIHFYADLQSIATTTDDTTKTLSPADLIPPADGPVDAPLNASYAARLGIAVPVPGSVKAAVLSFSGSTVVSEQSIDSLGGLRLLVRDPVSRGQSELPFQVAETFQPLPELVAKYRPVQIETGMDLKLVSDAKTPNEKAGMLPETRAPEDSFAGPDGVAKTLGEELTKAAKLFIGAGFTRRGATQEHWSSSQTDKLKSDEAGLLAAIHQSPKWAAWQSLIRDKERHRELVGNLSRTNLAEMEFKTLESRNAKAEFEDTNIVRFKNDANAEASALWQTWLGKAKEFLAVSIEGSDPTGSRKEQAKKAFDANPWLYLGRLVTVMRTLGLSQDLIAPVEGEEAWDTVENLKDELQKEGYRHIKVLAMETADGAPMATIRLVAMPWTNGIDGFNKIDPPDTSNLLAALFPPEDEDHALHYWVYVECVHSARLMKFRDQTREPLNLTLRPHRVLLYHWNGLVDRWHHDLEFAVQVLDRYHRIRERIREARADATLEASKAESTKASLTKSRIEMRDLELDIPYDVVPNIIRQLVVPRTEPLPKHPGVFAVPDADPRVIAVEMLDTLERQQAAHNALARTRYGAIQLHREWMGFFDDAVKDKFKKALAWRGMTLSGDGTIATDKEWKDRLGLATSPQFTLPSAHKLLAIVETNDRGRLVPYQAMKWGSESEPKTPTHPPAPSRGGDVEVKTDLPYYFDYECVAWFSSEEGVIPEVEVSEGSPPVTKIKQNEIRAYSGHMVRLPSMLGLPLLPTWKLVGDQLQVSLLPAMLGNHLTAKELAWAAGKDKWNIKDVIVPKIGPSHLDSPPEGQIDGPWHLPLLLLPDLWLEYRFSINTAPAKQPQQLRSLFTWAAPPSEGDDLAERKDGKESPMGFKIQSTLVGNGSAKWSESRHLMVDLSFQLQPNEVEAINKAMKKDAVFLSLRRGPLVTDYLEIFYTP